MVRSLTAIDAHNILVREQASVIGADFETRLIAASFVTALPGEIQNQKKQRTQVLSQSSKYNSLQLGKTQGNRPPEKSA